VTQHHRIAIVGTGFSGLGMAIRLKQEGEHDFVLLERASEIGGTWRDNTYPGCRCDVPSHLYSFSFAPNPNWSSTFSPQREILDYLKDTANRHGVLPHVSFETELEAAEWDDEERLWRIETSRGAMTAEILIAAQGPLSDPSVPAVPGIESFEGTTFHSAQWDHDHQLEGERVAEIPPGARVDRIAPAPTDHPAGPHPADPALALLLVDRLVDVLPVAVVTTHRNPQTFRPSARFSMWPAKGQALLGPGPGAALGVTGPISVLAASPQIGGRNGREGGPGVAPP
jgi:hypothetical protein